MNLLPDPLHPAVVHFPVVLILVGALAAAVAMFWRRHQLPAFAGILLALGAAGAWIAIETGESDGSLVENLTPAGQSVLEAHEQWAERTLLLGTIAAVIAIASAALFRFPRTARVVAVLAAVAGGLASYAVYETGHRGGALVFRHQAGIVAVAAAEPAAPPRRAAGRVGHEDRD